MKAIHNFSNILLTLQHTNKLESHPMKIRQNTFVNKVNFFHLTLQIDQDVGNRKNKTMETEAGLPRI